MKNHRRKKKICVCKLKLSLLTEAKLKLASVNKLCTLNLEFALFNLPALLLQVKVSTVSTVKVKVKFLLLKKLLKYC